MELPKIQGSSPNDVLPFKADVDVEEATLLQGTFLSEDCCGGNLPDTPHIHTTPTKTLKTPHFRHHHSTWVGVSYLLKLAIWGPGGGAGAKVPTFAALA